MDASAKRMLTDFTYLKDFSGNDQDFIKEMICLFIDNTPRELNSLKKNVHDENWDEVYKIAHTLKTSISFMGIKSIQKEVLEVEQNAKDLVNLNEIGKKVNIISSTCFAAIEELKGILKAF